MKTLTTVTNEDLAQAQQKTKNQVRQSIRKIFECPAVDRQVEGVFARLLETDPEVQANVKKIIEKIKSERVLYSALSSWPGYI